MEGRLLDVGQGKEHTPPPPAAAAAATGAHRTRYLVAVNLARTRSIFASPLITVASSIDFSLGLGLNQ